MTRCKFPCSHILAVAVAHLGLALPGCGGNSSENPEHCPGQNGWTVGTVTSVHDGDTLSLTTQTGSETVRLQGIDAPELAQDWGDQARQALATAVLHQQVGVQGTQHDRYGRLLGLVYSANCSLINWNMLESGMAWYYKAYACDLPETLRNTFSLAEQNARAHRSGLWQQINPEAPWIFRNGSDPAAPQCVGSTS